MDDYTDDDTDGGSDDQTLNGTLSNLSGVLGDMINPPTTVEAQKYARQILDQYQKGDPGEAAIQTDMQHNADQTREILKRARERIAARKFDKRNMWLAAAAGLGTPTETGAIGESAANLSRAILPQREKEQKFKYDQEDAVNEFDQSIGKVDDALLARRLQMLLAKQGTQGKLAVKALDTLGRSPKGPQPGQKGGDALDRNYAKEYVEFVQNGASNADRSIKELNLGINSLRNVDADGNPLANPDNHQTGPVIGLIPKVARDVIPWTSHGADVQDRVEGTVQNSLRPILGAQFTENEGKRLIERLFNPRMKEEVNAARLERFRDQVKRAYDSKQAMAKWWETHNHTLAGFQGKTSWSVDDFMPDDTWPGGASHATKPHVPRATPVVDEDNPADQDEATVDPKDASKAPRVQLEDLGPLPKRRKHGVRMPWELFNHAEGGRAGYAGGGKVSGDREVFPMPDGTLVEAPAGSDPKEVQARYTAAQATDGADDEAPPSVGERIGESAVSGGLSGLATKYGVRAGMAAMDHPEFNMTEQRIMPGEKRVLGLMEDYNIDPNFLAKRLRDLQRKQVPAMLMDVAGPEVRALGEASMLPKASETAPLLDELKARQKGARGRVSDQVNNALAPDPYTEQFNKLMAARKAAADPLYKAAYDANPKVPASAVSGFLQHPSFSEAWTQAEKNWKDRPDSKGKLPYKTDALGNTYSYPLEFLDAVKQAFDDPISEATRAGLNNKARNLSTLQRQYRDALDKATADSTGKSPYQAARSTFEEHSKLLDAMELGRDEFHKMSPAEAQEAVKKMSFQEKDALRTGVAESLFRQLGGPYSETNPANKLANSPDTMARLSTLFDNPKDFEIFKAALEAEQQMYDDSRGTLNHGKNTRGTYEPPKPALKKLADNAPKLGVFSPTFWALKRAGKEVTIEPEEADRILSILKSKDPKMIEEQLGSKFRRGVKRRKAAGRAGLIGAAVGAAAPFISDALKGDGEDEEEEAPPEKKAKGGPVGKRRKLGLSGLMEKYNAKG